MTLHIFHFYTDWTYVKAVSVVDDFGDTLYTKQVYVGRCNKCGRPKTRLQKG